MLPRHQEGEGRGHLCPVRLRLAGEPRWSHSQATGWRHRVGTETQKVPGESPGLGHRKPQHNMQKTQPGHLPAWVSLPLLGPHLSNEGVGVNEILHCH